MPNLFGQIDSLGKIYTKIVFEEIEVRDTNGKTKTNEEVFDLFYQIDTVNNCFGELKEEFIENLYSSNGLLIVKSDNEIHIIEGDSAKSEIEFTRALRNDNGEFLKTEIIFSADSDIINNLSKPINFISSLNDERLLTNENQCWVVDEIIYDKTQIYLDSCHSKYRLCFNNKLQYKQDFKGSIECETFVDKVKIKKEGFFKYWEDEVKHIIIFQEGKWRTKENRLYLTNKEENGVKIILYSIDGEKLILEPAPDYKVILKKASH